jgi:hypothetical protein
MEREGNMFGVMYDRDGVIRVIETPCFHGSYDLREHIDASKIVPAFVGYFGSVKQSVK